MLPLPVASSRRPTPEITLSYTSADRPGDPPIPDHRFVAKPDPRNYGSTAGCYGCAFKSFSTTKIRCSRIPCQRYPQMVAEIIPAAKAA